MDNEKLREEFINEFTDENWCSCGGEYSSETERQKVLNWFLSKLSLREQELWDKIEGMRKPTDRVSENVYNLSDLNNEYNSALSDIQKILKSNLKGGVDC